MTVAELLALPVGQRLRWEEWGLDGVVTAAGGGAVTIRFSDGGETVVSLDDGDDDDGRAEFAAMLERVEDADEPVIIDRGG